MTYSRDARGQAPWAGTQLPPRNPAEQPPPIPGDRATYAYAPAVAYWPWAYLGWAGGYPPGGGPGGGILAHADPAAGVVRLQVWWPDATSLQVVRSTPDGVRVPVRGCYPVAVTGTTRRNYAQNPSIEAGANGYTPDLGSPVITQLADAAAPSGANVLRSTAAAAGSNGVTVPHALTGEVIPAGQVITISFAMRTNAVPTAASVQMAWQDGAGGPIGSDTVALSADERTMVVGSFQRLVKTIVTPAGRYGGVLRIQCASGMPANSTMDLDAVTVEVGAAATDGSYFDGNNLGAGWYSTPELSASTLSPVLNLADIEAPLDIPLTYELSSPGLTGGRVHSAPPVTLASGAAGAPSDSWLSHPTLGALPVRLTTVPTWERAVAQGVFLPIGARRPVVVSAAKRQAPTGVLEMVTLSFAERDTLVAMLDDPAPMLLRLPAEFGYTAPMWLAVGKVTEDRGERKGWHDTVLITAEVTEIDAPTMP